MNTCLSSVFHLCFPNFFKIHDKEIFLAFSLHRFKLNMKDFFTLQDYLGLGVHFCGTKGNLRRAAAPAALLKL